MSLAALCQHALSDLEEYSTHVVGLPLRPYQIGARPRHRRQRRQPPRPGITVEMARQAGKNELSAQLEAYLLTLYQRQGGQLVKAAPTFAPADHQHPPAVGAHPEQPLDGRHGGARAFGNQIRLGKAGVLFFSAAPGANVVGATASLALEFDEAQDIAIEKREKDFYPMGSTTNATRVYYGTAWDDAPCCSARSTATSRPSARTACAATSTTPGR